MGTAIKVPTIAGVAKLSVGRWFKRVGDPVSIDEPLVEIDTYNLTHEIRAPVTGVLAKILVKGTDAGASPPAVNLRLKVKEMTNALSDGISALVDSRWSGLSGVRVCRHCISQKPR
jgi:pyruvate/2-oxoglutarate dehydrogenase complex dihydrolipoamide acyltransferase (E2) component